LPESSSHYLVSSPPVTVERTSDEVSDADDLASKGSSNPFLGLKPVAPISPCVGRVKIKKWLTKVHSEYWAAMPGMRLSKLFIEGPWEKLSRNVLALDRKQRTLVTGLLPGHCKLIRQLNVMGFLNNAI
jgi:hypothetical protein